MIKDTGSGSLFLMPGLHAVLRTECPLFWIVSFLKKFIKRLLVFTNRFKEVAALKMVWWLDITGKININLLSDDTLYAAYLVFKWNLDPYGFRQPVEASLVLAGTEHDDVQPSMVSLMQNPGSEQGQHAELRSDDWYEVELGQFFKRRGDMGEIEMSLKETKRPFEKKGLIVHGIEIRPVLP